VIDADGLTRQYGARAAVAVADVTFTARPGEILGLLGPNGAGKTTTLRMVTGSLAPTAGRVAVAGHDLATHSLDARRRLGYLPEVVALYPEMRVEEYLDFRAKLVGMARKDRASAIDEALGQCLLSDVRRQPIGTLSKGYRQRVGLAQAILHRPEVLVLDEPTAGLDPQQIVAIRELVRSLGRERTLMLSSHILSEVELLCDRVLILHRGRIVGSGTPEELARRLEARERVRLTLEHPGVAVATVHERLAGLPGVVDVTPGATGEWHLVTTSGAEARREIFALVSDREAAAGWTLLEMAAERPSLEEVFMRLTEERPS
jgi:ABC-2 type transport system ATP-binding protein